MCVPKIQKITYRINTSELLLAEATCKADAVDRMRPGMEMTRNHLILPPPFFFPRSLRLLKYFNLKLPSVNGIHMNAFGKMMVIMSDPVVPEMSFSSTLNEKL